MKLRSAAVMFSFLLLTAETATGQASTKDFTSYCTVGSVRTCASVKVWTTWDPIANVTRVQLWLQNQQGTLSQDNTGGAPITRIGLTAPTIRNASNLSVTAVDGATTVGTPMAAWTVTNKMIEGPVTFSTTSATAEGAVMGCNAYPSTVTSYFQTCGSGWVVFSFTTTNQWDAKNAEVAWKLYTNANDGVHWYACRTGDPATSGEYCESVDPTATPEPVTAALLGSGLAGLAALRRRRRKKDAAEL